MPTAYTISLKLDLAKLAAITQDARTGKSPRGLRNNPWTVRVAMFDGAVLRDTSDLTAVQLYRATVASDFQNGIPLATSAVNNALTLDQWTQGAGAHATFNLPSVTTAAFPATRVPFLIVGTRTDGQTIRLGFLWAGTSGAITECAEVSATLTAPTTDTVTGAQLQAALDGLATVADIAANVTGKADLTDPRFPVANIYVPSYANEVWLACDRNGTLSGVGNGRQHNPFDASTPAQLLARIAALPADSAIHLLPGQFDTSQINNEAFTRFRLVGAGMQHTILRRTGLTDIVANQFALLTNSPTPLQSCEVHDLTVDCNAQSIPGATALNISAIAVNAKYALIRAVKVINWGAQVGEAFVINLTGSSSDPTQCDILTIEGCIVEPHVLANTNASIFNITGDNVFGRMLFNTTRGRGAATCACNFAGSPRGILTQGNQAYGIDCFFHHDTNTTGKIAEGARIIDNYAEGVVKGVSLTAAHRRPLIARNRFVSGVPGRDPSLSYMSGVILRNCTEALIEGNEFDFRTGYGRSIDAPGTGTGANTGTVITDNRADATQPNGFAFAVEVTSADAYCANNRTFAGAPLPQLPDSPGPAGGNIKIPESDTTYTPTRRWALGVYHDDLLFAQTNADGSFVANFFLRKDGTFLSQDIPLILGSYGAPVGLIYANDVRMVASALPATATDGVLHYNGTHLYVGVATTWKQLD